jgi:periplasmic divalent cation tolerance protein
LANSAILALTTEANQQLAEQLASTLVERQLAACVALKPVTSIYRWQGQIERSNEVQVLIKSHPTLAAALEEAVRELHSYSTPQWLIWPAGAGEAYAAWLNECCAIS